MEYISASVQKVINTSQLAKTQLDKLLERIRSREKADKNTFNNKITTHQGPANMANSKAFKKGRIIITEYVSEKNFNPIQAMLTPVLHRATIDNTKEIAAPPMGMEGIASFVAKLHSIKEAAKSSTVNKESTLFTMHRLAPGHFLFLYAVSLALEDENIFGQEAVTSTVLYYKFLYNLEDKNQQVVFDNLQVEKENYLHMKKLKSELIDQLAQDHIDFDTWKKKDDAFSIAIAEAKAKLDASQFE